MLGIIYSPVLAPCTQMGYTTQLIAAPPVQLLPGLWGKSPAMAQPVSHARSPAIAKPCGEGTCSILARAGSSCAFLRPQESHKAQLWLLTSLTHVIGKGELCPPRGSSPQLLNCCLLAPTQGVGCCASPRIHPCRVTQVVELLPPRRGNFPAPPLGQLRHFWHLKANIQVNLCNVKNSLS